MQAPPQIQYDAEGREIYEPDGAVLTGYVIGKKDVDIIVGPLGSGKSKGSCVRIMRHAMEQAPGPDGLRKTRWAVVRNTFPDLRRTTIRTWLECFPEEVYGRFFWGQPPAHRIKFGDVRLEVDFLALDKPEDVRKLRSGEYTGIWFNEIQYIPKELLDEATSRVGRYPAYSDGGPTWCGVIADANAPDEDHWLGVMAGMVDLPENLTEDQRAELRWPEGWGLHLQPAALVEQFDMTGRLCGYEVNPSAENRKWLRPDYYERQIAGKSRAWIDSRLMCRVALVIEGSPVWPTFRQDYHVSKEALVPMTSLTGFAHDVWVGLDFGRSPAAVFAQTLDNRTFVQGELQGFNEGATTFAPKVKRYLERNYPGCRVRLFGDPKGRDKGQNDDRTAYEIFAAAGMTVQPAPVKQNNILTRIEAVEYILNDNPGGINRFVLSPTCRSLKVGMSGRYCWRNTGSEREPDKGRYSHLADALQYLCLGMGEGRRMTGRELPGGGMAAAPTKYAKARGSRRRVA